MKRRRHLIVLIALAALSALAGVAPAHAFVIQRVVSPGGIEAWLVEDHSLPIIALEYAFRGAGGALDPAGKEGLTAFAARLIDEGAGDLDATAFKERLEELSIGFRTSGGADNVSGSLRMLTRHSEAGFGLLALALTQPRFDPPAIERVRSQILSQLAQQGQQPRSIAGIAFNRALYGDDPYGRRGSGTTSSVRAIDRAAIQGVMGRLGRDRLIVGAVGDITPEALARQLDRTFGKLPATSEGGAPARPAVAAQGDVMVIERDGPQSVVNFGHEGLTRDDPDYLTATVVMHILAGSGLTSRLGVEVREKRGLTYGINAGLSPMVRSGLVAGATSSDNNRVAEAIALIREGWARMAADGPTPAELADAKTYLTGSYALNFDSSERVAGFLVVAQLERLGIDYFDRRNGLIAAITLEDAKRVAQRLLKQGALTFVVVGRPRDVRPTRPAPDQG
jgi:zinc protease